MKKSCPPEEEFQLGTPNWGTGGNRSVAKILSSFGAWVVGACIGVIEVVHILVELVNRHSQVRKCLLG